MSYREPAPEPRAPTWCRACGASYGKCDHAGEWPVHEGPLPPAKISHVQELSRRRHAHLALECTALVAIVLLLGLLLA